MKKLQPIPKLSSALDLLPTKNPESGQKLATMEQYEAMLADRPIKFKSEQVGYTEKSTSEYHCGDCLHYYQGVQAKRAVCEILRLEPEKSIPPEAGCKFFTEDGENHPLYESPKD